MAPNFPNVAKNNQLLGLRIQQIQAEFLKKHIIKANKHIIVEWLKNKDK